MMYQAGDLGLLIDFGDSRPASILQCRMLLEWYTYLVDGEPLIYPFDTEATATWNLSAQVEREGALQLLIASWKRAASD